MKHSWSTHASANLPRYTSYPTAADFDSDITPETVASWVGDTPDKQPISAYVHIPFCDQLCWYCGCATNVANGYDRVERFVQTLQTEIGLWENAFNKPPGMGHLHFGGGSPNSLKPQHFYELVRHLKEVFGVRSDMEFAVELDPRSLTPGFIEVMSRAGVTRASLGVQTLDPEVQKAVNRIQPRSMITQSIAHLRQNGIRNINMDLMYGLPHQTIAHVREAAEYAVEVGANRIAVFGYAHVPWFAKHQRAIDADALPGLNERFDQAQTARDVFEQTGYVSIGLDHFARPDDLLADATRTGHLHRNFQGYTFDPHDTLIGLGPSSISQYRQGFAQSSRHLTEWKEAVEAGHLPVARGIELTAEDQLVARAIEVLMCTMAVDTALVCRELGVPENSLDDALERAKALEPDQLCVVYGRMISIPEDARIMMRTVAACFDRRRQETATRHAVAV
ncbi:MAG: oxygen-independent coproporphyrinogen III oxidase [Pseudomonadota bacterium]